VTCSSPLGSYRRSIA